METRSTLKIAAAAALFAAAVVVLVTVDPARLAVLVAVGLALGGMLIRSRLPHDPDSHHPQHG